jgi:cell division protease FtsH
VAQKKKFKLPEFKGLASKKNPNKSNSRIAKRIFRGPLFWIIAALIAVSILGQISTTGKEFTKVETSEILNQISQNNVESAVVIDRDQKVRVVLKDSKLVKKH